MNALNYARTYFSWYKNTSRSELVDFVNPWRKFGKFTSLTDLTLNLKKTQLFSFLSKFSTGVFDSGK